MKKVVLLSTLITASSMLFSQKKNDQKAIQQLDIYNGLNLVERDTHALKEYVANDFILNPPGGKISYGRDRIVKGIREGKLYLQFDVVTDTVYFPNKKTAISMGSETAVYGAQGQTPGAPMHRRYTNFWVWQKGKWWLRARHSSLLCN
jgi:hypothetical protein